MNASFATLCFVLCYYSASAIWAWYDTAETVSILDRLLGLTFIAVFLVLGYFAVFAAFESLVIFSTVTRYNVLQALEAEDSDPYEPDYEAVEDL